MTQQPLPAPCPKCAPFDGAWQQTPDGMAPCDCPRGERLAAMRDAAAAAKKRKNQKAAEEDLAAKKKRRADWIAQKRAERKLAAAHRALPLMDGSEE